MTSADTPQPPQREALHFATCVRFLHNVTPLMQLQQVVVLLRLHPFAGGKLTGADTPQPPRQATPATPSQECNELVPQSPKYPVLVPFVGQKLPFIGMFARLCEG